MSRVESLYKGGTNRTFLGRKVKIINLAIYRLEIEYNIRYISKISYYYLYITENHL
jgi:hypothetical protein